MRARSRLAQTLGLAGWLAIAFVAGGIGALASVEAVSFYGQLVRPAWAPPAAVFGPVWTALYALMGVAAWLVWREVGARRVGGALTLFAMQLAVNALWSWLFFVWRNGAWAFIESLVLIALIGATMVAFWRVRRLAALLLIPYLLWVCFAAALTGSGWRNNPALLG